MDHDHPADSVGRITIHAFPHFSTGEIQIEPSCVKRGGYILSPSNPLLNIFNNLVIPRNKDDPSRTKIDGINTVPHPVDIDQLPVQSDGIAAAEKKIGSHLRLPDLKSVLL